MKIIKEMTLIEDDSDKVEEFKKLSLSDQATTCLAIMSETDVLPLTLVRHILATVAVPPPPRSTKGGTWFTATQPDFNPPEGAK